MTEEPSHPPRAGDLAAAPAQPWHLRLPAEQASVTVVAEAIETLAEQARWPAEVRFHVDLVLEELVQNIVSYAFPDSRAGYFALDVRREGDMLLITVEDDGEAFDPFHQAEPDLDLPLADRQIGGLGIHLTRTLMDACRYQREEGRNRIELRKSLAAATPG